MESTYRWGIRSNPEISYDYPNEGLIDKSELKMIDSTCINLCQWYNENNGNETNEQNGNTTNEVNGNKTNEINENKTNDINYIPNNI